MGIKITTKIGVNINNQTGTWSCEIGLKNKIESFQNEMLLWFPINKSLNKKPETIAPIAKKNKGRYFVLVNSQDTQDAHKQIIKKFLKVYNKWMN